MNEPTTTKSMRVKQRAPYAQSVPTVRPVEVSGKKRLIERWFGGDALRRNLAITGALALVAVAVRNAGLPQAQSVFATLSEAASVSWDESLGKLSFVSELLPQEVRAVWSEREAVSVLAPLVGQTVHAWSPGEPYVEVAGTVKDVRAAADGEVMSVAHGLDEERIVRIRHSSGLETVYGNLQHCYLEEGDEVYAGDIIARVLPDKPLAFELRRDGRSIDPEGCWQPQAE